MLMKTVTSCSYLVIMKPLISPTGFFLKHPFHYLSALIVSLQLFGLHQIEGLTPSFPAPQSALQPKLLLCFGSCLVACGILVPQPGIKLMSLALEAKSLNHRTTREVPQPTSYQESLPSLSNSPFAISNSPFAISLHPAHFWSQTLPYLIPHLFYVNLVYAFPLFQQEFFPHLPSSKSYTSIKVKF